MPMTPRKESYSGGPMKTRSDSRDASIPKRRSAYRTELTIPGSESVSVPSKSKRMVVWFMPPVYVALPFFATGKPARRGTSVRGRKPAPAHAESRRLANGWRSRENPRAEGPGTKDRNTPGPKRRDIGWGRFCPKPERGPCPKPPESGSRLPEPGYTSKARGRPCPCAV